MKFTEIKPLIIFEMANNHFGSIEHGKQIVSEFAQFLKYDGFQFAVKFQYRDLDNLIHKDYKSNQGFPYIKRFSETRMSDDDFLELKNYSESLGFLNICTPFDENSVKRVVDHGFNYIKIASASLTDWPLLEKIVTANLPIIASTAGASDSDLRRAVSFLSKRSSNLTIMHCVAKYPTSDVDLNLKRIDMLRNNYPNFRLGYSAHENPDNYEAVGIAYAKGASVFEKHVGLNTSKFKNNSYSCDQKQIRNWLETLSRAISFCGPNITTRDDSELRTLNSLRRGVYAKDKIESGTKLSKDLIYFAIPTLDNHLLANDWSKLVSWVTTKNHAPNEPILFESVNKDSSLELIEDIALAARQLCAEAGVILPKVINFEISHHYGLEKFDQFGVVMTTIVNRDYCKKILILKPGQTNPEHFHKIKEESFYCIFGNIELNIEGQIIQLKPGDLALIPKTKKHYFYSPNGAIIEEISSTSIVYDSYYSDTNINLNSKRKSNITIWN